MSAAAALSVGDLYFAYSDSIEPVLQGLSLDIPAGEVTAILGPNGSGKTTLLRVLLGILRPSQGQVLLAGRPRNSYSRREQSRLIGLVPQGEHVPFDYSVLEYVLLGRAPYLSPLEMPGETDRRIALEALETVGVGHLRGRPVPNLSGGERQLVTVARALAQNPAILLLDEPTAHLDLSNQGHLLEIMRTLAAKKVTQVFTTHDPNLAAAIADRTVLMRKGRILDAGPTAALLTAERLSATYDVAVQVHRVDGRWLIMLR
jgi:iron complex transport system ATP-binding protein